MASLSAFELEDQTDEEFFDKLVNDDDDIIPAVKPSSSVGVDDSADAKLFDNLIITNLGSSGVVNSGGNVHQDDVDFALMNDCEDNVVAEDNGTFLHGNMSETVNSTSKLGIGEVAGLNSAVVDTKNGDSGKSVKVVQWSSFGYELPTRSGSGVGSGSYSDFLNELGDDSEDPFANVGNAELFGNQSVGASDTYGKAETTASLTTGFSLENATADLGSSSIGQYQDRQHRSSGTEQSIVEQDLTSSQYWENQYPGWRYDPATGQWHQLDGYDSNVIQTASTSQSFDVNAQPFSSASVLERSSDSYHSQKTAQSAVNSVAGGYRKDVSTNNQSSQGSGEYPSHMVFDPQYPGWYYDTITQEWKSLESYTQSVNHSDSLNLAQQHQNRDTDYRSQSMEVQDLVASLGASMSSSSQHHTNAWETHEMVNSEATFFTGKQQFINQPVAVNHVNNSFYQPASFEPSASAASHKMTTLGFESTNEVYRSQSFNPAEQFIQHQKQTMLEQNKQINFSPAYFAGQNSVSFHQQLSETGTNTFYANSEGRSSAGRPPHALVCFGFGGKLIFMKNNPSFQTGLMTYEEPMGTVVNVLSLMEVVMDKFDSSSFGIGAEEYFRSVCQSFPGPLVGGSVGTKELNKWIDEQITTCETSYCRNGATMKLLFSLLKISCQHYGKLRLPFGTDQGLQESDCPELAVTKLLSSAKSHFAQTSGYQSVTQCVQNFPSEAQIQATALQVQKQLVSGRKKEALECAQEGQLWGPALVLASQLGDQFYGDTVRQMALKNLVAGSPLRTLCLLIGGNSGDVFSNVAGGSNVPGVNAYDEQITANNMLDEWEENLAIITANRTKGDELVITHLGDCLWKERTEVMAAHTCYLVAEANFEPYSDKARLCLVGADHLKFPRTYASPDAIQRTELYEYSKFLGNPQFLLLPFQPYKLVYAHMLAEVGKVADSLKYCQAILKSLRTGRGQEVDMLKQLTLSLEDQLKTHQQGGYRIARKLLTFFDNTAQKVVGGIPPPPPAPAAPQNSFQHIEYYQSPVGQNVGSHSTMAVPSLIPSASMEPISKWNGEMDQTVLPNRSISEPDFGNKPEKVHPSKEASPSHIEGKPSTSSGSSRFGRFGSQLFQKTVGLVIRSRSDRQAKLGEKNKFYYDEKLKRWVEEGVEPPAEEAALPPPPTVAAFQSGLPNHSKGASEAETLHGNSGPEYKTPPSTEQSPAIPPVPPSSNQFSTRGRMGVRSRYVDTFNKGAGGTQTSSFHSPPVQTAKPRTSVSPNFFIPTPIASDETIKHSRESMEEAVVTNETAIVSLDNDLMPSPSTSMQSPVIMQRFSSVDNNVQKRIGAEENGNELLPSLSWQAASWSGSPGPVKPNDINSPVDGLGMSPPSYMNNDLPSKQFSRQHSNSMDELDEIQL